MSKRSGPWEPWEFQVLHEGHDVPKTARLLRRDEGEVARRCQADFADWYRRKRCRGAPRNPERARKLAYKIWRDEFRCVVEEGDVEDAAIKALRRCFGHFDPSRGDPTKPVDRRFLRFFAYWLKRRLAEKARAHRRQWVKDRRIKEAGLVIEARRRMRDGDPGPYTAWARRLLQLVLPRLDPETRAFIRLGYFAGLGAEAAGRRLGIPERTRCRKYALPRLVERMRREVAAVIGALPAPERVHLVGVLAFEEDFSVAQIARLLCVPEDLVERDLRLAGGRDFGRQAGPEGWWARAA